MLPNNITQFEVQSQSQGLQKPSISGLTLTTSTPKRTPLAEKLKINTQPSTSLTLHTASKRPLLDQTAEAATKRRKQITYNNQNQNLQQPELNIEKWRENWKLILRESTHVYIESDPTHDKNIKRIKSAFKSQFAKIEPFFSIDNVTIIVSNRPFDKKNLKNSKIYKNGDIFNSIQKKPEVKVWNHEKCFRFFKNLNVPIPSLDDSIQPTKASKLSSLLKQEKLYGPKDRDPNARRDDVRYFNGYYIHVYDLKQKTRPIAIKEWQVTHHYPKFHNSTNGKSLFVEDTKLENESDIEKRHRRRLESFARDRSYRQDMIDKSYMPGGSDRLTYEERVNLKLEWEKIFNPPSQESREPLKPHLLEAPSLKHPHDSSTDQPITKRRHLDSVASKSDLKQQKESSVAKLSIQRSLSGVNHGIVNDYGEIQASGVNQSGSTAINGGAGGNGLAPSKSLVYNKKIANDKKKMMSFGPIEKRLSTPPRLSPNVSIGSNDIIRTPRKTKTIHSVRKDNRLVNIIEVRKDSSFVSSRSIINTNSITTDNNNKEFISPKIDKETFTTLTLQTPTALNFNDPQSQSQSQSHQATPITMPHLITPVKEKQKQLYSVNIRPRKLEEPPAVKRTHAQLATLQDNSLINQEPFELLIGQAVLGKDISGAKENQDEEIDDNTDYTEDEVNEANETVEESVADEDAVSISQNEVSANGLQLQKSLLVQTTQELSGLITSHHATQIQTQTQEINEEITTTSQEVQTPIMEKQKLEKAESPVKKIAKKKEEMKPGYCENCRIKYDDFDTHIFSEKHRVFAMNNDNFIDIDDLIEKVKCTRTLNM